MIILPGPIPSPTTTNVPSQLQNSRSQLDYSSDGFNDLTRYVVRLEEYIEALFKLAQEKKCVDETEAARYLSTVYLSCSSIPWAGLSQNSLSTTLKKLKLSESEKVEWSLKNELDMALVSISLAYTRLASERINELVDLDLSEPTETVNSMWKLATNHYKTSLSFVLLTQSLSQDPTVDSNLLLFLEKINNICIQSSILIKSSWIDRNSYNSRESFDTSNNGTLSRVAIYVLEELDGSIKLLSGLGKESVILKYSGWHEYLYILRNYFTAYAGFFLAIEYYQKDHLGQAIGLVNFSLLHLQSKKMSELKPKQGKIILKLKSRLSNHKNDAYITNLQSVTTLKIDKSVFQGMSGLILKDITFLFEQLVQLHLKLTKENDNLKFDKVSDWQDISSDSKWPLGCKIPSVPPKCFKPLVYSTGSNETSTRGPYY